MLNLTGLGKPCLIVIQTLFRRVPLHAVGTFTDFQRQNAYHNIQYSVTTCNIYIYISIITCQDLGAAWLTPALESGCRSCHKARVAWNAVVMRPDWILAEDKSDFRQFRKQSVTQVRLSILLMSDQTLPHLAITARALLLFTQSDRKQLCTYYVSVVID